MSDDKDNRFEYPIEFVRKNILGCLEASKTCCVIPGTHHLYHITFVARSAEQIARLKETDPVDFFLEAKHAHCPEVSWYLHLQTEAGKRQELPTQEPTPESLEELDKPILKMWGSPPMWKNTQDTIKPLTEEMKKSFNERVVAYTDAQKSLWNLSCETGSISSAVPHTCGCAAFAEKSTDPDTVTIGDSSDSRRGDPYTTGTNKPAKPSRERS